MGSVASQFVTPVITTSAYAGALAYGLHQIGRGVSKSGDTVTQNGGNAENTANSGNTTTKGPTTINSNNKNIIK
jgi:archaellum component FlaG (FlaF/FlaG flagellin family)